MTMKTCNKKIAVKPPESHGTKTALVNGVAVIETSSSLMKLEVVFESLDEVASGVRVRPGDFIVVRSQGIKHDWSKEVHDEGGVKFVLAPMELVLGVVSSAQKIVGEAADRICDVAKLPLPWGKE